MTFSPEPFRVDISDEVLADLQRRLAAARIAPENVLEPGLDPNGAWAYGTDRATLERYLKHWKDEYKWREQETALNAVPHFKVKHRGLQTHFIHVRSTGQHSKQSIPLLLLHGWPGSVIEFLHVIPKLAALGFDVVVPSQPGYAWSETTSERGGSTAFAAEHLHTLMLELGYEHYAAQGGDWGGVVSKTIALRYPQHCVALHINFCIPMPLDWYGKLKSVLGLPFMSKDEKEAVQSTRYFLNYETAYQQIQGTKPQSLAYGLHDSPVGLLAWHLEKFQSWADCRGGPPEAAGALTMDLILTNVMVYWVTGCIGSSFRFYYETLGLTPDPPAGAAQGPAPDSSFYVAVPTGVVWSKRELLKPPRHVAACAYNIKHWSPQEKGGHFFAFEQPETFVEDVRHFFQEVIDFEECARKPPRPGAGPGFQPGRYLVLLSTATIVGLVVSKTVRWLRPRL